jgi:hypothetical protein
MVPNLELVDVFTAAGVAGAGVDDEGFGFEEELELPEDPHAANERVAAPASAPATSQPRCPGTVRRACEMLAMPVSAVSTRSCRISGCSSWAEGLASPFGASAPVRGSTDGPARGIADAEPRFASDRSLQYVMSYERRFAFPPRPGEVWSTISRVDRIEEWRAG